MTDYLKYINALRKCAKEHENDRTSTGHIIVSDLCRDTANLLEELSSSEKPNKSEIPTDSTTKNCKSCEYYGSHHKVCNYCYKSSLWTEKEPITKNGISNRTIIYKAKESKEIQEDLNKLSELNKPTTKNDLPHCQCTDAEIAKSFIEDVEAVKDQLPCGEQMDFPNTFDEFVNDYGFKDKQEVYTNGSELIPVFRVKQWLEHINSSTTKNDLVGEFEEIEVTYPPEEVCIYPEYKGKPCFGIKYKKNGEEIVGYGTYNPEVLSQYLKDYFISTPKNDLRDDCISRADAIKAMQDKAKKLTNEDTINGLCGAVAILFDLPTVIPQEPTTKNDVSDNNVGKLEPIKNNLAVDCISRADINQVIEDYMDEQYNVLSDRTRERANGANAVKARINELQPVTPIRPKGHWISHREHCEMNKLLPSGLGSYFWCSECDCGIDSKNFHRVNYNYCPNCGVKNDVLIHGK